MRAPRVRHPNKALIDRDEMKTFTLHRELWLPAQREKVFGFFSSAENLEAITPEFLRFEILSPLPIVMGVGALIDYRLRLRGFPVRWKTEITAWDPPFRFVDEQKRGPYRLWIHEHQFKDHDGGTLCIDDVRYAVPGGSLVERWFVRRDVQRIFDFRSERLREIFTHSPVEP